MQVSAIPFQQKNTSSPAATQPAPIPVFRLEARTVDGEQRTAGNMPVWGPPQTIGEHITAQATAPALQTAEFAQSFSGEQPTATKDQPFGFGDLIDMVNPLQHIPLVNLAYRAVTGDEIRPIGKIVGGALFGGPVGGMVGGAEVLADTAMADKNGTETNHPAFTPITASSELEGTTLALANLRHSDFTSFTLNT